MSPQELKRIKEAVMSNERRNLYSLFRVTAKRWSKMVMIPKTVAVVDEWMFALFVLSRASVASSSTSQQYGGVIIPTG